MIMMGAASGQNQLMTYEATPQAGADTGSFWSEVSFYGGLGLGGAKS